MIIKTFLQHNSLYDERVLNSTFDKINIVILSFEQKIRDSI